MEKLINGIRCETVRNLLGYKARIAIYENGKRLYVVMGEVIRISRGDAMRDAAQMAHDLKIQNFLKGE